MTHTPAELRKIALDAPMCFPLSSKGEIEAGIFYDAIRPNIVALLDEVERYQSDLRTLAEAMGQISACAIMGQIAASAKDNHNELRVRFLEIAEISKKALDAPAITLA